MDILLFTVIDRDLIEVILLFLVMAIFSVAKRGLNKVGNWNLARSLTKVFVNFIAGVSLYSMFISYDDWFGDYPQKLGIAMFATYIGDKIIDILVDKTFDNLSWEGIKNWIKKVLNL